MSNLFVNPIIITGDLATSYKTQMAATGKIGTLFTLVVERIRWVDPGISKTISIGDPLSGAVLFSAKSNTAGEDVDVDFTANPQLWQDFEINAFPSGTLYLYTR